jgi:hypothetical protein
MTVNVNSGDIVSFDLAIVGKALETSPSFEFKSVACSKFLTWDQCSITSVLTGEIVSFSINIKNTIIPVYTSTQDPPTTNYYAPNELRFGTQEVTGTVSTYGFGNWTTGSDALKFKLNDDTWSLNVLYNPTQSTASGSSEPYVSSTPFVGASDKAVWNKTAG